MPVIFVRRSRKSVLGEEGTQMRRQRSLRRTESAIDRKMKGLRGGGLFRTEGGEYRRRKEDRIAGRVA